MRHQHTCCPATKGRASVSKSQARIRTKILTETPTKTLAGEGRVHDCLRKNRDKLSDSCRQEELHLNIMQAQVRQLLSAATLATEQNMLVLHPKLLQVQASMLHRWAAQAACPGSLNGASVDFDQFHRAPHFLTDTRQLYVVSST